MNEIESLYLPDPKAKGQWWHFVAALKADDGREFGVQCTMFQFATMRFTHCALTDVAKQRHTRTKEHGWTPASMQCARWFTIYFRGADEASEVDLDFVSDSPIVTYPSETSIHFGYQRMRVSGFIGGQGVTGVGCFDREIFDRLLLPGENGWIWRVNWMDDGTTDMEYYVNERVRLKPTNPLMYAKLLAMNQDWPRTDHSVGYTEALVSLHDGLDGPRVGTGYIERVGNDGVPDM